MHHSLLPPDEDLAIVQLRTVEDLISSPAHGEAPQLTPAPGCQLTPTGAWPDVDYTDQTWGPWQLVAHLNRLMALAVEHRRTRDDRDKRDALLALDFWLQHDFRNPNWWHNEIGTPQMLGNAALLLEEELTRAQKEAVVRILKRSSLTHMTGANLVWMARNQVVRGLLQKDPAVVDEAFRAMWAEVHIAAPGGEGIQADRSFHQHGTLLYNGGYGDAFIHHCTAFIAYAHGTRFQIPSAALNLFLSLLLDGQQWMVRGQNYDYSVLGRQIVRPNQDAHSLVEVSRVLARISGPRQPEMRAFHARLLGEAEALCGNRHFWCSDYMTHQRPAYYASVRMFSQRTFNSDGYMNSEGKRSHHIADGLTFFLRCGQEYKNIFPVWDWRRLPGTTIVQEKEPLDPAQLQRRGETSFVGGVSDKTCGAATMHLHRDGLSALKSWFFVDEGVLCLGAGIQSAAPHPVFTTCEQAFLKGDVYTSLSAEPLAPGQHSLGAVQWIWHDGQGYYFFQPGQVFVSAGPRSGSWADIGAYSGEQLTHEVFCLWIDHGVAPQQASYSYLVVPNCTPEFLRAWRPEEGFVEILSNSPQQQAAHFTHAGLTQVVFHAAGICGAEDKLQIGAGHPCLVQIRENAEEFCLTASNPENLALALTLHVNRVLQGPGCATTDGATTIEIRLPEGEQAGSSVPVTLRAI